MQITFKQSGSYQNLPPVPSDMYHARFIGHKLIPAETSDDYDRVLLEFEIYDEQPAKAEWNGRILRKRVRDTADLRGNLRKICEALVGRELKEGDTVELDALVGQFVLLDVGQWTTPDGKCVNVVRNVLRPLYHPNRVRYSPEDDPFAG